MDLKTAFNKMKTARGSSLHFFFCEAGADGKPVLLVEPKPIPPSQQADILQKAKKKTKCSGEMVINPAGELEVTPRGSTPAGLAKNMQVAARNANAMVFSGITIKPAIPEETTTAPTTPGTANPAAGMTPYSTEATNYNASNYPSSESAEEDEEDEDDRTVEKWRLDKEELARLKALTLTKKHEDALKADPTMAKLIAKKAAAAQKLEALLSQPDVAQEDIAPVESELRQIGQAMDKAQQILNARGVTPKNLAAMYDGEEKKVGWRANPDKASRGEQFNEDEQRNSESDHTVTRHHTEEERKNAEIKFDEQGRAVGKRVSTEKGTMEGPEGVLHSGKVEYVMDTDGQMHQFQQHRTQEDGRDVVTHHSSVLAGKEVAAAGEAMVDYRGYLTKITNKSGHYKPGAVQVIQLLEELAKQGALLDKTYRMPGPDGKSQPLQGKARDIFEGVAKVEAGLKNKLADGKNIEPDLAAIKQAKLVLAKLGVAPANNFRDVEVEFLEGADAKTGAAIRTASGDRSTAAEFLATGGGNARQADNKLDVNQELKEKLKDKKQTLDEHAEARADDVEQKASALAAERLPAILQKCREKLAAAEKDDSETSKALRPELKAAIGRIEKALQTADLSPAALESLADLLADLQLTDDDRQALAAKKKRREEKEQREREEDERWEQEEKLRAAQGAASAPAQRGPAATAEAAAAEPMPGNWAASAIDLSKYPINLIAERLGLTVDEVKGANPYGADPWPVDLVNKFKDKIGVKSVAELFQKLNSQPAAAPAPEAEAEPMSDDWGTKPLDLNKYPIKLIAERLGLTEAEVQGANEYGGEPWPGDILNKFKDKIGVKSPAEMFQKLNRRPAAQPETAAEPMPLDWGSKPFDLQQFPIDVIAQRLGLTVDEVKEANPYGGEPWPGDILNKFKDKIGVKSAEELFQKLNK